MASIGRPSIYRLDDEGLPVTINALVYGYSGIGKTPFWGTGGRELLLMDSDNGIESAIASKSKCEVVSVPGFKELTEVFEYLRYSDEAKKTYRWVSWDGITLFMDRVLVDELLPDAHAQNPRQSQDVASQREYLILQNRVSDFVRRFVALPYNFGMSALVMTAEDPEGKTIYMPFIPGKKGEFSSKICGYMNIVGYYGLTPKGTRRIVTAQTGHYYARDRFDAVKTRGSDGKLHAWLNDPTVPKIDELVERKRHGKDQAQGRQGSRRAVTRRRI